MMCQWEGFLRLLPPWIRETIDITQCDDLEELRIRVNSPPELRYNNISRFLCRNATMDDVLYCINSASRYSPWAASTIGQGYITSIDGHRIGLCGTAIVRTGKLEGIRDPDSVCIRLAKDYPQIGKDIEIGAQSVLIIGAPGWGKTTLLRSIVRRLSLHSTVSVVDERGEIMPTGFDRGLRMDVLRGCSKREGIPLVLRTMSPEYIAVDEITSEDDIAAVCDAANCGVPFLATAHAASIDDLYSRPAYKQLVLRSVFQKWIVLRSDKTYTVEDGKCSA